MGRDNQKRGSGRGNGRGRGYNRSNSSRSNKNSNSNNSNQSIEMKFTPHIQGKPQQATYATVKDAVIQYIQKNYKNGHDVATSLKKMVKLDLSGLKPVRAMSANQDAAIAANEQKGLDIEYQEMLSHYLNRVEALDLFIVTASSLIYTTFCMKTMQSRIEEHPEFAKTIEDDPWR